jgi:hypothetical protein
VNDQEAPFNYRRLLEAFIWIDDRVALNGFGTVDSENPSSA